MSVHSPLPICESGVWLCLFSLFFSSPFQEARCVLWHMHMAEKMERGKEVQGLGMIKV